MAAFTPVNAVLILTVVVGPVGGTLQGIVVDAGMSINYFDNELIHGDNVNS